jgi:hypothetical protein
MQRNETTCQIGIASKFVSSCQTYFSGIQLTETWVFIQPINILVDYSNSMFDIKIIFLKKDNPFCPS